MKTIAKFIVHGILKSKLWRINDQLGKRERELVFLLSISAIDYL